VKIEWTRQESLANKLATSPKAQPLTVFASQYLGNVQSSAELAKRVAQAASRCWQVEIGRGDRTKARILTQTVEGQSVGIVKGRDWQLREGDVLAAEDGQLVMVRLRPQPVMVLRFDLEQDSLALLQLGHALGNQHWPLTVHSGAIYVALVGDAKRMEATVRSFAKTFAIEGLQISFEESVNDEAIDFAQGHSH
jgi:urease accessory protein